jgi:hypothetical protein
VVLTSKGGTLTTAADILVVNDLKIVNKTLLTIMLANMAIARIRDLHPWYWVICKVPNRFVSIATNRAILRRIVSSCETIFLKVGEDVEMVGMVDEEMGGETVVVTCI